ncbi:MAG: response regulator [Bacteroidetes bacterium]|nr:MAG: response regulator [Bacteroidota bacterium]
MKTILIIEDQPEVRENLAELLELSNYRVLTAENGKVGVQLVSQHNPDLILCDVMMPELDGFGVLRILERKPETARIPFIFLTAKAEKADFRRGMNLGADDYITKPYDEIELLNAVEMRLKKSERLKAAFDGTPQGLSNFIDELRGQQALEGLSRDHHSRFYAKKESIYREGDFPRHLYFIESGAVKIYKTNEMGKEYVLQILEPGQFFGHLALIKGEEYSDSAAALEDTRLRLIPKDDFLLLLYGNPNCSAHFISILTRNLVENEEKLLSLAYNSIRQRVAEALIDLYRRQTDDKIEVLRDDLAGMVGTAKESVIRTLKDFKEEQLIKIDQGVITILDPMGLMKISG